MNKQQSHIERFYDSINKLAYYFPYRKLKECNGNIWWPEQGIYLFYEKGELRNNNEPRVVRIGTHGISKGSKTTLWNRLKTHKGTNEGFGNHRGSVFRKLIGQALINRDHLKDKYINWGIGNNATKDIKEIEKPLEYRVSEIIGEMPFLFLEIKGEASSNNMRAFIETNTIALLSNVNKQQPIDKPSKDWLGLFTKNKKIINSGLWNRNDVDKKYDPFFLDKLDEFITLMIKTNPNGF